jgi:hypothetical protein
MREYSIPTNILGTRSLEHMFSPSEEFWELKNNCISFIEMYVT